ncbi:MAG: protease complex subunit PrcB family protein [Candidatus Thiodiazotropha sp.]
MTTGAWKYPLLLGVLLTTAGCLERTEMAADEAVVILKRSDQCRISEPTFRSLRDRADLHRVMPPAAMMAERHPALEVDFSTHAVMLLGMGQKPTTGFHIEIDTAGLRQQAGTLWLPVRFIPPAGEVAAARVTSPCVIFSLRREGVQRIVAGDTGLSFRF